MHNRYMIDDAVDLLEAVHRYGGVNAAADVLGRSASGVSRRLQGLADELDVALLRRVGRAVELTSAGEALLAKLPELRRAQESVLAALAEAADPEVGELRLAAHTFAVAEILPQALDDWRARRPRSRWRIREAEPATGMDLLADRRADLVLMPVGPATPDATDPRFLVEQLLAEPIDLVLPPQHRLTGAESATLEQLREDPWILGSPGQGSREEILAACRRAGYQPVAAHHAQDWAALSGLVAAGEGVSLLPRLSPTHSGVVRVALSGVSAPTRSIVAVSPRGSEERSLHRDTVETLRAVARTRVHQLGSTAARSDDGRGCCG